MLTEKTLLQFADESNRIEGIRDDVRRAIHTDALRVFLEYSSIGIDEIERFVKCIEPDAFLRKEPQHRVWIGGREAPAAPKSVHLLGELLRDIRTGNIEPFLAHAYYEGIHPFIDGNGRSGRALWLWMMCWDGYDGSRLFLNQWYYQSLACVKWTERRDLHGS